MNTHDLQFSLFIKFKKNTEEHVYIENGKHYIFYANEHNINKFSISSDLSISDAIFFKQPIGSKLQVIYSITPIANNTTVPPYRLDLVISNYFIYNKEGRQSQIYQGEIVGHRSIINRLSHIAEESVKYVLQYLEYIPLETNIDVWFI